MSVETALDLAAWRAAARASLGNRLLPDRKSESWRFTDLRALEQATFTDAPSEPYTAQELGQGAWLKPLSQVWDQVRERVQTHAEDVFALRNAAHGTEGWVLYVPAHVQLSEPITVESVTAASSQTYPRLLVILERGSEATLVERYATEGFSNAVSEIYLADNASLKHCLSQTGSGIHILTTAVQQATNSRYQGYALSSGQQLSRHSPTVQQNGENCETRLYGLCVAAGQEIADTHSAILHQQAHGSSEQLHKCVLRDRAEAVFRGRVRVEAQQINSSQASRTLLRSSKARIDSQPQLEILADDVKCTHGATVGELEPSEVFYMQSRGLERGTAINLLTYAFAAEILETLPVASLRQEWQKRVQI